MFLQLKQLLFDENTNKYSSLPVTINTDLISCYYPAPVEGACFMILSGGTSLLVDATYKFISDKLPGSSGNLGSWIPVTDHLPLESDDYIVSLATDRFNITQNTVEIDRFKNGRWQTFGRKVIAWMPFPKEYVM